MKLFWTGTDSLMLVDYSMRKLKKKPYWFVFRILVKVMELFIECHYCDSENVSHNLKKFGMKKQIKVFHDKLKYNQKYAKIKHNEFNIIYYNPKSRSDKQFAVWLYGLDIIEEVKLLFPNLKFIELDGTKDMSRIFPITDFMLRPNRHDGASRLRQECEIQEIPYYWSYKNPDINEIKKTIQNEIDNKQKTKLQ